MPALRADATVGYCSAAARATTSCAASVVRVAGSSGWSGRLSTISSTLTPGNVVVVTDTCDSATRDATRLAPPPDDARPRAKAPAATATTATRPIVSRPRWARTGFDIPTPFENASTLLLEAERGDERLLRHLDAPDLLHPLLAFLLALE